MTTIININISKGRTTIGTSFLALIDAHFFLGKEISTLQTEKTDFITIGIQ